MAHRAPWTCCSASIGPHYDSVRTVGQAIEYEFDTRNVPDTMATMVDEPYVNHIPTMTGGVGAEGCSHGSTRTTSSHSNPPTPS